MRAYRHPYRRPSRLRKANAAPHRPQASQPLVNVTCNIAKDPPPSLAAGGFLSKLTGLVDVAALLGGMLGRRRK